MDAKEEDLLQSVITGGIIGGALAALLSKGNKDTGTISLLGAIAGAAIVASFKASENAKKTNIPLIIEENNNLYEISPDGTKKLIKQLPATLGNIPKKFTLS